MITDVDKELKEIKDISCCKSTWSRDTPPNQLFLYKYIMYNLGLNMYSINPYNVINYYNVILVYIRLQCVF